jgi:hypothetical protein
MILKMVGGYCGIRLGDGFSKDCLGFATPDWPTARTLFYSTRGNFIVTFVPLVELSTFTRPLS